MTRFSEIARDIESQYDPDFDIDNSKTAPPVRYIEYRLLELCETLNERLTALEDKPQAPSTAPDWLKIAGERLIEIERLTAEVADRTAKRDAVWQEIDALKDRRNFLENEVAALTAQRNALAAEVDDLRNVNAGLRKENAGLIEEVNVLRRDYGVKRRQYDEVWKTLNALQNDMS